MILSYVQLIVFKKMPSLIAWFFYMKSIGDVEKVCIMSD